MSAPLSTLSRSFTCGCVANLYVCTWCGDADVPESEVFYCSRHQHMPRRQLEKVDRLCDRHEKEYRASLPSQRSSTGTDFEEDEEDDEESRVEEEEVVTPTQETTWTKAEKGKAPMAQVLQGQPPRPPRTPANEAIKNLPKRALPRGNRAQLGGPFAEAGQQEQTGSLSYAAPYGYETLIAASTSARRKEPAQPSAPAPKTWLYMPEPKQYVNLPLDPRFGRALIYDPRVIEFGERWWPSDDNPAINSEISSWDWIPPYHSEFERQEVDSAPYKKVPEFDKEMDGDALPFILPVQAVERMPRLDFPHWTARVPTNRPPPDLANRLPANPRPIQHRRQGAVLQGLPPPSSADQAAVFNPKTPPPPASGSSPPSSRPSPRDPRENVVPIRTPVNLPYWQGMTEPMPKPITNLGDAFRFQEAQKAKAAAEAAAAAASSPSSHRRNRSESINEQQKSPSSKLGDLLRGSALKAKKSLAFGARGQEEEDKGKKAKSDRKGDGKGKGRA